MTTTTHPLLDKYSHLSDVELLTLPLDDLVKDTTELTSLWETRKQENALLFYEPAQEKALQFHKSVKKEILISGGNRSSKTDTVLVELAIQATGIVPYALRHIYPQEKLTHRPIRARLIGASFLDNIEGVIKPKFQWWKWDGAGAPGGSRGHWGWIPRSGLLGGDWAKAYSEKHRVLTLTDGGTIQFNSYDQEVEKQAGASKHLVVFDELPPKSHYIENRMRVMDTGGQLIISMTPPTEASGISAAWVYDALYEPGLGGHPDIDTWEFFTEDNKYLSQDEIRRTAAGLTEEERQVRLYGRFLHLSGLVHPLFTTTPRQWCLTCDRPVTALGGGACPACGQDSLLAFTHVVPACEWPRRWPVVFVIDPHPRKPCAISWTAVDEDDQWLTVAELEASGTAEDVAHAVFDFEAQHDLRPAMRLIDPNAAECRNDKMEQGWTLRREFDRVGLRCTLANDAFVVGKDRFNDALRPNPLTQRPRWQVLDTCQKMIYGLSRFTWDEWTRQEDLKSPKPKPRDKYKDFPDLCRYLAMANPTFHTLHRGYEVIRYRGRER